MTKAPRLAWPENGCQGCPPTPVFAWGASPSFRLAAGSSFKGLPLLPGARLISSVLKTPGQPALSAGGGRCPGCSSRRRSTTARLSRPSRGSRRSMWPRRRGRCAPGCPRSRRRRRGLFSTKVWTVSGTTNAILELADHLSPWPSRRWCSRPTSDYWRPFSCVLEAAGLHAELVNAAELDCLNCSDLNVPRREPRRRIGSVDRGRASHAEPVGIVRRADRDRGARAGPAGDQESQP